MIVERSGSREVPGFCVKTVDVAGNYGPCKGVDMAIDVCETVLREVGGREPVFATNPIVHNNEVMEEFGHMGLRLVSRVYDVPRNGIWVNSAHAHTPEDFKAAEELELITIDTVCPLVNKVYVQGRKAVAADTQLVYFGSYKSDGDLHQESRGFMGQFKGHDVRFVASKKDLEGLTFDENRLVGVLNQTTLATDEFKDCVEAIKEVRPDTVVYDGICYATDNRQNAVVDLADTIDAFLISGSSKISHNTKMLMERAYRVGKGVFMIETAEDLEDKMFLGIEKLGYTAGASVRDKTSLRILNWFSKRGTEVRYSLPVGPEPGKSFRWPEEDLQKLRKHMSKKYAA